MKPKKIKTHVLFLSEYYQSTHPKKGESTHFWERVLRAITEETYYPAHCECGYHGMSNTFHGGYQIADTGDYSDIVCPKCGNTWVDEYEVKDFIQYYHSDLTIWNKLHTCRENYENWKRKIEEVQRGEAILSIRGWTGKPYNSKVFHIINLTKDDGIGVEELYIQNIDVNMGIKVRIAGEDFYYPPKEFLAKNDGLKLEDFQEWFKNAKKDKPYAIIHFSKFRYAER